MSEEITASSSLDVSTYLLAFKWAKSSKKVMRRLMYGVVIAGALFAAWMGVSDGQIEVQDVLPSLLCLFFLGFVIRRTNDVTRLSEQIKQMPGYGGLSTWTITPKGYDVTIGELHDFVPWTEVVKTVATPDGILIYIQKDAFEWLPKTAFTSDSDYARFLELIADKTKHSKIG